MLKKFLVIFAIFLLSFFAYLSLSNPTAMSVSQTSPNFWLPLSISIIFLFFFLILLGMNERELAEKVGILKKIREKEAKEKVREVLNQYSLSKYLEELRNTINEAGAICRKIEKDVGFEENRESYKKIKIANEIVENLYRAIDNLKQGKQIEVLRYLDYARKSSEILGYKEFAEKLWLLQGKMEVTYNIRKIKLREIYEAFPEVFND
jgi:hypothetical protein